MKHLRVFKFGGASIKDPERMRNVARIVAQHAPAGPLAVVVSALGKTTNALEEVVASHAARDGRAFQLLDRIKQQHYDIARELFGESHEVYDLLNDRFAEAEWVLEDEPHPNYDYMYDQIICVGELASSTIMAALLQQEGLPVEWVDARDVIITDDIFREGWVQWDETIENAQRVVRPLLEQGKVVLTQGFIASTRDNETTTLGREGSDYTAAILSYCLDAESMTIWKDVPGILTGDPRVFDNVIKLDEVSYREAIEMTYYGAKVIHPKTIKPLQNKSIPLFVKSFLDPEAPGTVISGDAEDNYPPIVVLEQNQALLHISTRDFSFVAEHHMSYLFQKIAEMRLQVNMMQNTAISFSICVNDIDDKVDRFAKSIEDQFKVKIDRGLELITVRYYQKDLLESLRRGKVVMLEERIRKTVQMVVKDVPIMKRKDVPTA
ncbi:MAG: aspartate kinase [Bacteroidetes bacterium]|nr:MAG: aspartate kinase [Bacteroidota bacterium]